MDAKWFPSPDRPFRSGTPNVIGANGIGMATLLLPPGLMWRNVIAFPLLLWIAYNVRHHTTSKPEEDYLTAINVAMAMAKYFDFSLRIPERSLRRIRPDGSAETAKEIASMSVWQKFQWNFDLFTTMRGIGWNWKVKNVDDVPQQISRR